MRQRAASAAYTTGQPGSAATLTERAPGARADSRTESRASGATYTHSAGCQLAPPKPRSAAATAAIAAWLAGPCCGCGDQRARTYQRARTHTYQRQGSGREGRHAGHHIPCGWVLQRYSEQGTHSVEYRCDDGQKALHK